MFWTIWHCINWKPVTTVRTDQQVITAEPRNCWILKWRTQLRPAAMAPMRGTRNLVVCLDGTANQFSVKNTNIVELYGSLDKSKSQRTYYNSGIGTYVKPSWWSPKYLWQLTDNMIDMMAAWYVTGALFYV
ncbi:hypothetical protein HGRIS_001372 [Hohenbuehelia grisea]|uniref:T6SS Phospholipase effector Tle1-like catalytic domain-containing protein n=1 Tax=Hohenbuehelia grisea TaxID=104357 RepID=A0ABR3JP33_9AGAR